MSKQNNKTKKNTNNKSKGNKIMRIKKSKIHGLADGIETLIDRSGVNLNNLTSGLTSDGRMSYAALMALPSGTPAPAKELWVRRWAYAQGTIRRVGSEITVEFNDKRDNKVVKTMKRAYKLLGVNTKTKKKGNK